MRLFYFVFLFLSCRAVFTQLSISANYNLENLIQEVVGTNGSISNVTFIDNGGETIGRFSGGDAFGISSGLLISTGRVTNALPPNILDDSGEEINPDPVFGFYDRQIVQFDFIANADELSFNYVFASEEYPEYVDSLFNDEFEISIRGNEYAGWTNFSLIPGTSTEVSINTVNNRLNSQFFVRNRRGSDVMEYDGYTRVLNATTPVVPCQTYQVRFFITDIEDGFFDSGVFIEGVENYQDLEPEYSISYQFDRFDRMVEGCNDAQITLYRPQNIAEESNFTIYLNYEGSADRGVDYSVSNDLEEVLFPVSVDSVTFGLSAFSDQLIEGMEDIQINLSKCSNSSVPFDTIQVEIGEGFDSRLNNQILCVENSTVLNPNPINLNDRFTWQNPYLSCNDCLSPNYLSDTSGWVSFTIQDIESGCVSNDSIFVTVYPLRSIFDFSESICYTSQDRAMENSSTLGDSYRWFINGDLVSEEFDPVLKFGEFNVEQDLSSYEVMLVVNNDLIGCSDTSTASVTLNTLLFIPNIITPNQDDENEMFEIQGISQSCWTLRVLNRWGRIIYEKKDYQNDWNGGNLADGIYYYYLFNENREREFKGYLHIIR